MAGSWRGLPAGWVPSPTQGLGSGACCERLLRTPKPGAVQVITAQANYMRVLVQWDDLTPLQRETRDEQLRASALAASCAWFSRRWCLLQMD